MVTKNGFELLIGSRTFQDQSLEFLGMVVDQYRRKYLGQAESTLAHRAHSQLSLLS